MMIHLALLLVQAIPATPAAPAPSVQDKPPLASHAPVPQDRPPAAGPAPVPTTAGTVFESVIKKVTLGGQVRLRAEYRDPTSYANTPAAREDDDIYLSRIRLNLGFQITEDIDVFFQPQDQRTFGDEASVLSDEQNLDVHQGWVEFRRFLDDGLTVRAGRMELQYGDQRLVSPLDWSNIARAWDGVKFRYAGKSGWLDGFYTVIREGAGAEDDHDFSGLYGSFRGLEGHELDAYVFASNFRDDTFLGESGRIGDLEQGTTGIRIKGVRQALDYTVEAAYQFGSQAGDRISAFAGAATAGVTLASLGWKPYVGLEYTYATGDDDPTDRVRQTFDPLYSFVHFYQGFADQVGWKNGHDAVVHLRVAPAEGFTVHLDLHSFWLDERRDAWYSFNGAPTRRDATGSAPSHLAMEGDFHFRYAFNKHVKLWAGWSYFYAGAYIRETPGSDRDMNWGFAQLSVDF